jgi:hypothetical protein
VRYELGFYIPGDCILPTPIVQLVSIRYTDRTIRKVKRIRRQLHERERERRGEERRGEERK